MEAMRMMMLMDKYMLMWEQRSYCGASDSGPASVCEGSDAAAAASDP